ncbi:hypothetical protein Trydic_g363 [Trypoxylus dichotomus]
MQEQKKREEDAGERVEQGKKDQARWKEESAKGDVFEARGRWIDRVIISVVCGEIGRGFTVKYTGASRSPSIVNSFKNCFQPVYLPTQDSVNHLIAATSNNLMIQVNQSNENDVFRAITSLRDNSIIDNDVKISENDLGLSPACLKDVETAEVIGNILPSAVAN